MCCRKTTDICVAKSTVDLYRFYTGQSRFYTGQSRFEMDGLYSRWMVYIPTL